MDQARRPLKNRIAEEEHHEIFYHCGSFDYHSSARSGAEDSLVGYPDATRTVECFFLLCRVDPGSGAFVRLPDAVAFAACFCRSGCTVRRRPSRRLRNRQGRALDVELHGIEGPDGALRPGHDLDTPGHSDLDHHLYAEPDDDLAELDPPADGDGADR